MFDYRRVNPIKSHGKPPLNPIQPPLNHHFPMVFPTIFLWFSYGFNGRPVRPFFPIRHQESRLLRAIFRLHPSLKDVKVYEGLVDDPEVTIEGPEKQPWLIYIYIYKMS